MSGKVLLPLKVSAWRKAYSVCFRLQATFFYKKCRDSTTRHRQQSTKVNVKGRDLICSQICSSMLHYKRQNFTVWFFSMLLLSSRLFPYLPQCHQSYQCSHIKVSCVSQKENPSSSAVINSDWQTSGFSIWREDALGLYGLAASHKTE